MDFTNEIEKGNILDEIERINEFPSVQLLLLTLKAIKALTEQQVRQNSLLYRAADDLRSILRLEKLNRLAAEQLREIARQDA